MWFFKDEKKQRDEEIKQVKEQNRNLEKKLAELEKKLEDVKVKEPSKQEIPIPMPAPPPPQPTIPNNWTPTASGGIPAPFPPDASSYTPMPPMGGPPFVHPAQQMRFQQPGFPGHPQNVPPFMNPNIHPNMPPQNMREQQPGFQQFHNQNFPGPYQGNSQGPRPENPGNYSRSPYQGNSQGPRPENPGNYSRSPYQGNNERPRPENPGNYNKSSYQGNRPSNENPGNFSKSSNQGNSERPRPENPGNFNNRYSQGKGERVNTGPGNDNRGQPSNTRDVYECIEKSYCLSTRFITGEICPKGVGVYWAKYYRNKDESNRYPKSDNRNIKDEKKSAHNLDQQDNNDGRKESRYPKKDFRNIKEEKNSVQNFDQPDNNNGRNEVRFQQNNRGQPQGTFKNRFQRTMEGQPQGNFKNRYKVDNRKKEPNSVKNEGQHQNEGQKEEDLRENQNKTDRQGQPQGKPKSRPRNKNNPTFENDRRTNFKKLRGRLLDSNRTSNQDRRELDSDDTSAEDSATEDNARKPISRKPKPVINSMPDVTIVDGKDETKKEAPGSGKKKKNKAPKKKENLQNEATKDSVGKKDEVQEGNSMVLSKTNLGENNLLMKFIGDDIPSLLDALCLNVNLNTQVTGVIVMSDPNSQPTVLDTPKTLMDIVAFKMKYPKAKSIML